MNRLIFQCIDCGIRSNTDLKQSEDLILEKNLPATVKTICYNCYSDEFTVTETVKSHFVDYANSEELTDPRWSKQ